MKHRILRAATFFISFFLAHMATANILQMPENDDDGAFEISWSYESSWLECKDQKIHISGNNQYHEILTVRDDQRSYKTFNLPVGDYIIGLHATCEQGKGKDRKTIEDMLDKRNIAVGPKLFTKSLSVDRSLSSFSTTSDSCNSGCSIGSHSIQKGCVGNCPNFSYCSSFGGSNFHNCQPNTDTFWTCDYSCGTNHKQIGIESTGNSLCASGALTGTFPRKIQCTIREPNTPKITSATRSLRGEYNLTWSSSSRASRYEWRRTTGSWINVGSSLSGYSSGLPIGNSTFEVKACNVTGCSGTASISVVVGPDLPSISLNSNSASGTYDLSWTNASGADYYEWQENGGAWQATSATLVAFSSKKYGVYTYRVRSCQSGRGCTTSASSASITVGTASPTITLPQTSADGNYKLAWNAVPNAGYYEWRENSNAWVSTTSREVTFSGKATGTYQYSVRSCQNGLGCSSDARATIQVVSPTITIGSFGNVNSTMNHTATCLSTGETCTVIGNKTTHPGPRYCSITCPINQTVEFRCKSKSGYPITDYYVPSGSVRIADPTCNSRTCAVYRWAATSNATGVDCVITD